MALDSVPPSRSVRKSAVRRLRSISMRLRTPRAVDDPLHVGHPLGQHQHLAGCRSPGRARATWRGGRPGPPRRRRRCCGRGPASSRGSRRPAPAPRRWAGRARGCAPCPRRRRPGRRSAARRAASSGRRAGAAAAACPWPRTRVSTRSGPAQVVERVAAEEGDGARGGAQGAVVTREVAQVQLGHRRVGHVPAVVEPAPVGVHAVAQDVVDALEDAFGQAQAQQGSHRQPELGRGALVDHEEPGPIGVGQDRPLVAGRPVGQHELVKAVGEARQVQVDLGGHVVLGPRGAHVEQHPGLVVHHPEAWVADADSGVEQGPSHRWIVGKTGPDHHQHDQHPRPPPSRRQGRHAAEFTRTALS